jgi:hypothetical protein
MSIENLLPVEPGKKNIGSIVTRLKNSLIMKETPWIDLEFYNEDRTRRFSFYEFRGENHFRQLNIRLSFKIGVGWLSPMTITTRHSKNEERLFGLEIDSLTEDSSWPVKIFYFDHHTGGLKRKLGMSAAPMDLPPDEFRKKADSLGIYYSSKLPQFVDFEKTAKEFMAQAKSLDFSLPTIYKKGLLD